VITSRDRNKKNWEGFVFYSVEREKNLQLISEEAKKKLLSKSLKDDAESIFFHLSRVR
jgi:hypothetical protein